MEFSRAVGLFLLAGLAVLLVIRFYVNRPLPSYETPLALGPGALGGAGSRLLILAPHSDDETLGAGGLIREALAAGGAVQVVLVTNGDGFTIAAEEQLRSGRLNSEQYVELGRIRQRETIKAMQILGLGPGGVVFLGYPDRGLVSMWEQYWDPSTPYTSRYTHFSRNPYSDSYQPGAVYCGQGVSASLEALIRAFNPTEIVVTHPNDAHPDHWATYIFTVYALERLRLEGFDPAREIKVYTYLVHRGDWPLPRGYHPGDPLNPPATLAGLTTQWYSFALDRQVVDLKRTAVDAYQSQTSLMPFYLRSFIRKTELFGFIPEPRAARGAARPAGGGPAMDAAQARWWGISPVVVDPLDDTIVRRAEKGADLRAVYALREGGMLRLLIKARGTPTSKVQYSVLVSDLAGGGQRSLYRLAATPPGGVSVQVNGETSGARWTALNDATTAQMAGDGLEISVNLEALGDPERLLLSVESQIERITIDRTEWTSLWLR